jgi:hypothetical protein
MTYKDLSPDKRLIIVLSILAIFFALSFFLPLTVQVDFTDKGEFTSRKMIYEGKIAWIFAGNFLILATAALSKNRNLIIFMSILMFCWTGVLNFFFEMGFTWSGQGHAPDFGYGYWLNQLTIIVLGVYALIWIDSVGKHASKMRSRLFSMLAIGIIATEIFGIIKAIKSA